MVIIGITGTHGAGKGTVTEYLAREYGFVCFSVSEFLAEEAVRRNMKPDRVARRNIANEYRAQGPMALMEAAYTAVDHTTKRLVLEPQYTVDEVHYIQGLGGVVIALDADLKTRYERVYVRGSAKDDVSFEDFKMSQEQEMQSDDPNKNNLADAMNAADIHLMNNGSITELEQSIERSLVEKGVL